MTRDAISVVKPGIKIKIGTLDSQDVRKNLLELGGHTHALAHHYVKRAKTLEWPSSPWNPQAFQRSFLKVAEKIAQHPQSSHAATQTYIQDLVALGMETYRHLLSPDDPKHAVIEPDKGDRRFKDESWSTNPYFSYVKQSYLLWDRWLSSMVTDTEGLDEKTRHQAAFFTKQLTHSLAPSNFFHLNPEVMKKTMVSGGMNILNGLTNFVEDLGHGDGFLKISMVDKKAFKLGETLATTPGQVVFQNQLIQLIQYTPRTATVHQVPVVLVPPCINKFYIYDLKPENSFVRWLLDQSFIVFMISWVNPSAELSHKTFEDYALEGIGEALRIASQITQEPQVNAVGFCIGGNMLSMFAAYDAHKSQKILKSLTFLATPFDFDRVGDLRVFINEDQLNDLERHMNDKGFFDGEILGKTFNMLRANDLIWSFVINNYLLGQDPAAFDILYWNGDSTRLPAAMYIYYLKNLFLKNLLIQPGALTVKGLPVDLRKITAPTFILNTHRDHIIPWECGYEGAQVFGGPTTFALGGSGHVAGIFNHPTADKYCYWTNPNHKLDSQDWLESAEAHHGSWWGHWSVWLKELSGPLVVARTEGSDVFQSLEPAPGSYVTGGAS